MSERQKAKARMRYLDPDNPIRTYVQRLEQQINGKHRKKSERKMAKIRDLRAKISYLERENQSLLMIVHDVEQAIGNR